MITTSDDTALKPTSIVGIGVGNRMRTYLHYLQSHPDRARLVAVVEPDEIRRDAVGEQYGVPADRRYATYEEFFRNPVAADAVFICTPENEHYRPTLLALRAGYHVLLEKPVARTYAECRDILEAAEQYGRMVCVCHVLRYHPCFMKVRELASSGRYGRIISIKHTENVGLDRMTHSYVRGTMNTAAGNNPLLLAKCCHDIDFLAWVAGSECVRLSSFGSLLWFRRDNAPAGSTDRCIDCPIERRCPYSAVDLYDRRRQWISNFDIPPGKTIDDAIAYELAEGRHGRCVYRCDNDVVDNQVLAMQMADGTLATLAVDAFTRRDGRLTEILLTHGEIICDGRTITVTDFTTGHSETIDMSAEADKPFHAGSDLRLVETFIRAIRENRPELIEGISVADAIRSHRICFEAERSRLTGLTVSMTDSAEPADAVN